MSFTGTVVIFFENGVELENPKVFENVIISQCSRSKTLSAISASTDKNAQPSDDYLAYWDSPCVLNEQINSLGILFMGLEGLRKDEETKQEYANKQKWLFTNLSLNELIENKIVKKEEPKDEVVNTPVDI